MNQIASQSVTVTTGQPAAAPSISPQKLAHLDIGLLRNLKKLGTSTERICGVLGLSREEFDYVCQLT